MGGYGVPYVCIKACGIEQQNVAKSGLQFLYVFEKPIGHFMLNGENLK